MMISTPTHDDIGRGVVYRARHPNAPAEDGVIVGFSNNPDLVFVRYRDSAFGSKSTTPSDRGLRRWHG